MNLRDFRAFSPPRPASGRGGRGVSPDLVASGALFCLRF